ncbi:hypothetical protein [Leptotrichia trevisanii]|uniref:Short chain dehydrogenase n=1 Tax=Leptotrichia trevisanii TaxID=109328 RepID=A0A510K4N5_9FUSO|nr:hypothetical protein [Leptotrichia trevisanii]BBM45711.1 short chain dehydrogenase [Leptotrichia trevisanii]
MAKEGHVVYGAARRTEKMEDLKQFGVKPIYLDVTDEDSIKSLKKLFKYNIFLNKGKRNCHVLQF